MGLLNSSRYHPDQDQVTDSSRSQTVDTLVRAHLPLVGHVAHGLAVRLPSHLHRDDLVSAGLAGLAEAATSFDPGHGVPFNRYAVTRIRGAMLDELRSADWASRGARSREREYLGATARLEQTLGRTPRPAEVAAELGIDMVALDARRAETGRRTLSLDALDTAAEDVLPDAAPDPEQQVVAAEQAGYLRSAVAALPPRLRTVVTGLFLQERPLAELAEELDVSESRVSQMKTEALSLLHDAMQAAHGEEPAPPGIPAQTTAQRRRQAYYAEVAAGATRAGLGAVAAGRHEQARRAAADSTRTAQRNP